MNSTPLSTILNRLNRYQVISTSEEQFKVRDIDESIRTLRREFQPPWVIKQTTITFFKDTYIYPVASDHQHLALIERKLNDGGASTFKPDLKARYTSLQQFYEDQDSRNLISEVWDGGNRFLGVRYKTIDATSALASGNTASNYTASGTASSPTAETVETIDGLNTVKFTVTAGTATMTEAISPSISDSNYLKRYYFRWIYLDAAPTSIELRFGNDSSNYLGKTVTTQFGGQAFKDDSWNLVAMNLNEISATGTIASSAFDYALLTLNGAATGTYFIGPAYLRGYKRLDYFYYSTNNIRTSATGTLSQDYFFNESTNSYTTSHELLGSSEWIDCIIFDAALTALADSKDKGVIQLISEKRRQAWEKLMETYPDMVPPITTQNWNFGNSPSNDWLTDGFR